MQIIGRIAAVAATLALAGCAAHSSKLKPPTQPERAVRISEAVVWSGTGIFGFNRSDHGFAPGLYVAVGEDVKGTYYKGPAYCFHSTWKDASWITESKYRTGGQFHNCGLLIPAEGIAKARIYIDRTTMTAFMTQEEVEAELARQALAREQAELALQRDPTAQDIATLGATMSVQAALTPAPGLSPMQAGLGGAIGMGVVAALMAADNGDIFFHGIQPENGAFESAARFEEIAVPPALSGTPATAPQ